MHDPDPRSPIPDPQMKALVYTAPHEIVYRDEPPPQRAARR